MQEDVQNRECRPGALLDYEPMFDSKTTLAGRLTDAVDLLIDFATLGEYGMEPCESTAPACQSRRRSQPSRTGARASRDQSRAGRCRSRLGAGGGRFPPSMGRRRWALLFAAGLIVALGLGGAGQLA